MQPGAFKAVPQVCPISNASSLLPGPYQMLRPPALRVEIVQRLCTHHISNASSLLPDPYQMFQPPAFRGYKYCSVQTVALHAS